MTAQKAALSSTCTSARQLGRPEPHARCAGNSAIRTPNVPIASPTEPTGRGDCTCYATGDAS